MLFLGTGDIAIDMENQVKANAMRIQVLEEQNEGLRNSDCKGIYKFNYHTITTMTALAHNFWEDK
jgi:hypothetical protein